MAASDRDVESSFSTLGRAELEEGDKSQKHNGRGCALGSHGVWLVQDSWGQRQKGSRVQVAVGSCCTGDRARVALRSRQVGRKVPSSQGVKPVACPATGATECYVECQYNPLIQWQG